MLGAGHTVICEIISMSQRAKGLKKTEETIGNWTLLRKSLSLVSPSIIYLYIDIHKQCVIAIGLPLGMKLPCVLKLPFLGGDLYTPLKGLL